MKLYGIKNCNTVKKAVLWLNDHQISFEFHDYNKSGISKKKLQDWNSQVGFNSLINRKGTTWRKQDEEIKNKIEDEKFAIVVLTENPSMIKRPIIERDGKLITIGFDENEFEKNYNQ